MGKNLSLQQYETLTYQGAELYNQQDFESALDIFIKLSENNWDNPKVHEILSYIYLNLGNVEKSKEEFHIYMDLLRRENPDLIQPRSFDEIVEDAGELVKVKAEYDKIMKKKTCKDPFAQFEIPARLSVLYMSEGKYKKAEEVLVKYKERFVDKLLKSKIN